jgi:hypothetical protein
MTTAQESTNGHRVFPPLPVENPDESNRADLPTNKANTNANSAAKDDQAVESQKGVPITPLLAHEEVERQEAPFAANAYHVPPKHYAPRPNSYQGDDFSSFVTDPNPLPDRCQFDHPTRMVVPSEQRERGTSPELRGDNGFIDTSPLPDRCQFMFSDGRQCAMARSDIHPSLCRFHSEREDQLFGSPSAGGHVVGAALDLPELYSACRDLTTAAGVNRALAQVFRLLAQRRISRQEAATFGHLAQLLLRSISAMRALAGESHGHQELSPVNKVAAPADQQSQQVEQLRNGIAERQKEVALSRANKVGHPTRMAVPSEHREPRDLSFCSPRREANAAPASCAQVGDAIRPPREGYHTGPKASQQDELSPPTTGALFAGNRVIPNPPLAGHPSFAQTPASKCGTLAESTLAQTTPATSADSTLTKSRDLKSL